MDELERKRATTDSFGAVAASYLDSDVHREGADLELLASWCDGASTALDVACGAGHTAGALAETADADTVVAADATPEMVETATDAFPVVGTVADAERLPFSDEAFDAVTCRIAAHHFPNPDAFVSEVARVLAPGGVVAFEDNPSRTTTNWRRSTTGSNASAIRLTARPTPPRSGATGSARSDCRLTNSRPCENPSITSRGPNEPIPERTRARNWTNSSAGRKPKRCTT
nr:class I SAM-dependent methyltransferase [Haladaptatus sp. R4]